MGVPDLVTTPGNSAAGPGVRETSALKGKR